MKTNFIVIEYAKNKVSHNAANVTVKWYSQTESSLSIS